jgi:hypothetical protein
MATARGGAGAAGPAHLHRQGVVLCETGQLGRRVGAPTPEAHPATRRPEPRGGPAGPRTAVPARPPARRPAGRSPAGTRAAGRSGTAATARPGRPRPWPGGAPSGRGAAAGWSSRSRARCWPSRGAAQAGGGGPAEPAAPRCPLSAQPPAAPRAASRSCLLPPQHPDRRTPRGPGCPALPPGALGRLPHAATQEPDQAQTPHASAIGDAKERRRRISPRRDDTPAPHSPRA